MKMEAKKGSFWSNLKNHLQITRLSARFSYISGCLEANLKKISDESKQNSMRTRLEELMKEDKSFNVDDGSIGNLNKYKEIVAEIIKLKKEIDAESILKDHV